MRTQAMVEIPDSLKSVFTASVEEQLGEYVVRIPDGNIDHDAVVPGETYRIAITDLPTQEDDEADAAPQPASDTSPSPGSARGPPVEEGEILDVTIETVGDQGDGIAKVDRGFVLIVPDAKPGDEPTVRIESVHENMAFAEIVEQDTSVQL